MSSQESCRKSFGNRISDVSLEKGSFLNPIVGIEKLPIVSFEETMLPLQPILSDLDSYVFISIGWAESLPEIPFGLSIDAAAAINIYTREWHPRTHSLYYVLNERLRLADRENLKPFFPYLRLLLSALEKCKPYSNLSTVWRGVKANLSTQYQKGKKTIWWGCSSCTTDMSALTSFLGKSGPRTLFNIHFQYAFDIQPYSIFQTEHEVFLPPARYLEVINIFDAGGGLSIVELQETTPRAPLIHFSLDLFTGALSPSKIVLPQKQPSGTQSPSTIVLPQQQPSGGTISSHESDEGSYELVPQLLPNQTTKSYSQQVEQASKAVHDKINLAELSKLLKLVTEGNLDEVKALLEKTPALLLGTETITDLSHQKFINITALQYAVWALDKDMCELIMGYLGAHNSAIQLMAWFEDHANYTTHGLHYDFQPLIMKTKTYLNNYADWNDEQCCHNWQKEVGGEQHKCPAWLIYAWCESGRNSAWRKKDFTCKINHEYKKNWLVWWFSAIKNGGSGVGSKWAAVGGCAPFYDIVHSGTTSGHGMGSAVFRSQISSYVVHDVECQELLFHERQTFLTNLQSKVLQVLTACIFYK